MEIQFYRKWGESNLGKWGDTHKKFYCTFRNPISPSFISSWWARSSWPGWRKICITPSKWTPSPSRIWSTPASVWLTQLRPTVLYTLSPGLVTYLWICLSPWLDFLVFFAPIQCFRQVGEHFSFFKTEFLRLSFFRRCQSCVAVPLQRRVVHFRSCLSRWWSWSLDS